MNQGRSESKFTSEESRAEKVGIIEFKNCRRKSVIEVVSEPKKPCVRVGAIVMKTLNVIVESHSLCVENSNFARCTT